MGECFCFEGLVLFCWFIDYLGCCFVIHVGVILLVKTFKSFGEAFEYDAKNHNFQDYEIVETINGNFILVKKEKF